MKKYNSFLYDSIAIQMKKEYPLSDIDNEMQKIGYFETTTNSYLKNIDSKKVIELIYCKIKDKSYISKQEHVIGYYCGSFSIFHDGHISVIKDFFNYVKKNHPNHFVNKKFKIVLSPANSDYLVEKYNGHYTFTENKFRFDLIKEKIKGDKFLNKLWSDGCLVVDINPMLNNLHDYNFTDLIKNFCDHHYPNSIKYIICGKDKKYFKNLEKYQDYLKVFYSKGKKDLDGNLISSSALLKINPYQYNFNKKDLILRCWNVDEYLLFKKYFSHQYKNIIMQDINEEISYFNSQEIKIDFTICKDYKFLYPYIPFHRQYDNPLGNTHFDKTKMDNFLKKKNINLDSKVIIDSDCFTGATKHFLESEYNCRLYSFIDLSNLHHQVELLDIDDFRLDDFAYPKYDMASKCSMPSFNFSSHKNFNEFKTKLKQLNK